jgi:hypothetical protein
VRAQPIAKMHTDLILVSPLELHFTLSITDILNFDRATLKVYKNNIDKQLKYKKNQIGEEVRQIINIFLHEV